MPPHGGGRRTSPAPTGVGRGTGGFGSSSRARGGSITRESTQNSARGRGTSTIPRTTARSRPNAAPRGHATPRGRGRSPDPGLHVQASKALVGARDPSRTTDKAAYTKFMADLFQKLREDREPERKKAIRDGFLADPEKKTTLAEAITPVGTCQDMCPEFERVERIVQHAVDKCERKLADASDTKVAWEPYMVKRFRRSAAGTDDQIPSDIRPPLILKKTLNYLLNNVIEGRDSLAHVHKFVWDRTRAIRNDFSIQQVTKADDIAIAIECFERIARFHLLSLHQLSHSTRDNGDFDAHQEREQLGNTLLSLIYYYDDSRKSFKSPNEAEFRAYGIIFEIQDRRPDLEYRVQTWPKSLLQDRRVQVALELHAAAGSAEDEQGPLVPRVPFAIAQANFGRFWALVRSPATSYLAACAAEVYFNFVRTTALGTVYKSYRRPTPIVDDLTLDVLSDWLAFDNQDQTQEFCVEHGIAVKEKESGVAYVDLSSVSSWRLHDTNSSRGQIFSYRLVESKRYSRMLSAIIKGYNVARCNAEGLLDSATEEYQDRSLFLSGDDPTLPSELSHQATQSDELSPANPFQRADAPDLHKKQLSPASPFASIPVKQNPFEKAPQLDRSPFLASSSLASVPFNPFSKTQTQSPSEKTREAPLSFAVAKSHDLAEEPSFGASKIMKSSVETIPGTIFKHHDPPLNSFHGIDGVQAPSTIEQQENGPDKGANPASNTPKVAAFNSQPAEPTQANPFHQSLLSESVIQSQKGFGWPHHQQKVSGQGHLSNDHTHEVFKSPAPVNKTASLVPSSSSGNPDQPLDQMPSSSILSSPEFDTCSNGFDTTKMSMPATDVKVGEDEDKRHQEEIRNERLKYQEEVEQRRKLEIEALNIEKQELLRQEQLARARARALDSLAHHYATGNDGLLDMFLESLLSPLISKSLRKVAREQERSRVKEARAFLLSSKYLRRWKLVAYNRSLTRTAQARRLRMAEARREARRSLRSSRANSDSSGEVEPLRSLLKSDVHPSQGHRADALMSHSLASLPRPFGSDTGSQMSTQTGRSDAASQFKRMKVSHSRSSTVGAPVQFSTSENRRNVVSLQHENTRLAHSQAVSSDELIRKARRLVSGRTDTTQTDYFRLKALGVSPDTPVIPETRKRARTSDVRADFTKASPLSPQPPASISRWSRSVSHVTSDRDTLAPSTPPGPFGQDDELFAKVREVRQAMAESEAWFKSTREQHESQQHSMSAAQSRHEKHFRSLGSTTSRTTQRHKASGSHGYLERLEDIKLRRATAEADKYNAEQEAASAIEDSEVIDFGDFVPNPPKAEANIAATAAQGGRNMRPPPPPYEGRNSAFGTAAGASVEDAIEL